MMRHRSLQRPRRLSKNRLWAAWPGTPRRGIRIEPRRRARTAPFRPLPGLLHSSISGDCHNGSLLDCKLAMLRRGAPAASCCASPNVPPTLPGYGRRVLGSDPLWWYHRQKFYSAITAVWTLAKAPRWKKPLSLVFYKFGLHLGPDRAKLDRGLEFQSRSSCVAFLCVFRERGAIIYLANRVAISLGQHRNIRRRSVNASLSGSTQPAVTKIVPHARAATRSVARLIKTTAVRQERQQ